MSETTQSQSQEDSNLKDEALALATISSMYGLANYNNFTSLQALIAKNYPAINEALLDLTEPFTLLKTPKAYIPLSAILIALYAKDFKVALKHLLSSDSDNKEMIVINLALQAITGDHIKKDAIAGKDYPCVTEAIKCTNGRKYLVSKPVKIKADTLEKVIPYLTENLNTKYSTIKHEKGQTYIYILDKGYDDIIPLQEEYIKMTNPKELPLGKDIFNELFILEITSSTTHTLGGGTTGGGKTALLHLIAVLLIKKNFKVAFIDLKGIELVKYKHYKNCVGLASDLNSGIYLLNKLVALFRHRKEVFNKVNCSNIDDYNEYCREHGLPEVEYIYILVDEWVAFLEDASGNAKNAFNLLLAQSRAFGFIIFCFTQFASDSLLSSAVKANFSNIIAFKCSTKKTAECLFGEEHLEPFTVLKKMKHPEGIVYIQNGNKFKQIKTFFIPNNKINEYIEDNLDTSVDHMLVTSAEAEIWCRMNEKGTYDPKAAGKLQGSGITVDIYGKLLSGFSIVNKDSKKRSSKGKKSKSKKDEDDYDDDYDDDDYSNDYSDNYEDSYEDAYDVLLKDLVKPYNKDSQEPTIEDLSIEKEQAWQGMQGNSNKEKAEENEVDLNRLLKLK